MKKKFTWQNCERSIKRFIVNPSVQWRFTAMAVVGVFVVSAFVAVILYGVLFDQARSRALHMPTASAVDVGVSVVAASVAFAAVPAIACGLWAIAMTHRLCGPVRVIENHLRKLDAGSFPRHRPLRKKDSFREVYALFWRVLDKYKDVQEKQVASLGRLRDEANEVVAGREDANEAVVHITAELNKLCREASSHLALDNGGQTESDVPVPEPTKETPKMAEVVS